MTSRETGNNTLLAVLAVLAVLGLGGAAVFTVGPTLFPTSSSLFFYSGVLMIVVAAAGLAVMNWSRVEGKSSAQLIPAFPEVAPEAAHEPTQEAAPEATPQAAPEAALHDNPEPITVDVPIEEQQRLGRTFVRKNVTPKSLIQIYEGRTSDEAGPLAKSQIGKWIRLWVRVLKTQGSGDRILVSVSMDRELSTFGVIMMYFHGQHDHLSMLRPDDRILVQGEITDLYSFALTLENCELLSVGDEAIS